MINFFRFKLKTIEKIVSGEKTLIAASITPDKTIKDEDMLIFIEEVGSREVSAKKIDLWSKRIEDISLEEAKLAGFNSIDEFKETIMISSGIKDQRYVINLISFELIKDDDDLFEHIDRLVRYVSVR